MSYPKFPDYSKLVYQIKDYGCLKSEYGSKGLQPALNKAEAALRDVLRKIKSLPIDKKLAAREPNALPAIRKLRPKGPRVMWKSLPKEEYREKLEGALLGRMAGCTLGAIVEAWSVSKMENWAKQTGDVFPPVDYWSQAEHPTHQRYSMSACSEYTRSKMNGVPVDDDVIYTLLGLLVAEDYGPNFTVAENGKAWVKYLPLACTAEDVALKNLKKGISALKVGEIDNPYCEWIGADIRSDPWAYMAPGLPEFAADMAYRDAYLSHRRNGVYGEMFFSAAIAAAFAVDNSVDALRIGLTEIPKDCSLAKHVRWALEEGKGLKNYKDARAAVDERFAGMHTVHTINNACLTVFGLMIGGDDLTKVISETVAMGLDNDCTAATAGSLLGAIVGKKGIQKHWYKNFNNTIHSYLIGKKKFSISDVLRRFERQAVTVFENQK